MIHEIIPLLGGLDLHMNNRSAVSIESLAWVGGGQVYERIAVKIKAGPELALPSFHN
jgi:hypothetical protein